MDMKFTVNPELDAVRWQYKQEYDQNFESLCKSSVENKHKYRAIEKMLHSKTLYFMRQNAQYFRAKRKHFWKIIDEVSIECSLDTNVDTGKRKDRYYFCGPMNRISLPE